VYVSLASVEGLTRVRIEENLRPLAGQYFGGIMGGVGGGSMGVWMGIGMGVFHSPVVAIGLAVTAIGSTYGVARKLFRRQHTKRSAELNALADRIVTLLESPPKRLRSR
jgi:predicted lipid-binding transport protein (Tim44 family)